MNLLNSIALWVLPVLFIQCSKEEQIPHISTIIYSLSNPEETIGSFEAYYLEGVTYATLFLHDQAPGSTRAVHLHTGSCADPMGHWNMGFTDSTFCNTPSAGGIWGKPYAGDMGNVFIGETGSGSLEVMTDLWSISTGEITDIDGLTVIVHGGMQDFELECNPEHQQDHEHPNPKIGCGSLSD